MRLPYNFRSVFTEEQLVHAAENFFYADGRGEEAIAGKNSAGNHLAFRPQTCQRKNRRVLESRVGADLPLDALLSRARGIDENQIRLKPTRGVKRQLVVVFFADDIFPGAFQCSADKPSDAGFMID